MVNISIDGDALDREIDSILQDEEFVSELSLASEELGIDPGYLVSREGFQWLYITMLLMDMR